MSMRQADFQVSPVIVITWCSHRHLILTCTDLWLTSNQKNMAKVMEWHSPDYVLLYETVLLADTLGTFSFACFGEVRGCVWQGAEGGFQPTISKKLGPCLTAARRLILPPAWGSLDTTFPWSRLQMRPQPCQHLTAALAEDPSEPCLDPDQQTLCNNKRACFLLYSDRELLQSKKEFTAVFIGADLTL